MKRTMAAAAGLNASQDFRVSVQAHAARPVHTVRTRRTAEQVLHELERDHNANERIPVPQRVVESAIAAAVLILSAPIMAVLAIMIRLDSPGRALFLQKRVGRGGRLFTFIKFRTYHADAKERFPDLYAYDYTDAEIEKLHFKIPNDRRATRVGKWLRQTTLDELPNFWNVFTGDLALVGPRPEIPEMLPYYRPDEMAKFSVRPGVTGLAQISGRGRLSFRDTTAYDVEYVRNKSFWLDVSIMFRTLQLTIIGDGAF